MIKIEIIDPTRENPDVLVKLAAFLMECAGHTMVKAPSEMQETYTPTIFSPRTFSDLAKSVDEGLEKLNQAPEKSMQWKEPEESIDIEQFKQNYDLSKHLKGIDPHMAMLSQPIYEPLPDTAPYQHCSESDLTNYTKCEETGLTEISEDFLKEQFEKTTNAFIESVLPMRPPAIMPSKHIDDEPMNLGNTFKCEDVELPVHNHIIPEKPKRRKRKIEIISETGVTEVTENLFHVIDIPPAPVFAPPPPINGNTLIDKIVKAKSEQQATHEEITAIVRKHGLVSIKDIFINDHLIPLIDADLDELLGGK